MFNFDELNYIWKKVYFSSKHQIFKCLGDPQIFGDFWPLGTVLLLYPKYMAIDFDNFFFSRSIDLEHTIMYTNMCTPEISTSLFWFSRRDNFFLWERPVSNSKNPYIILVSLSMLPIFFFSYFYRCTNISCVFVPMKQFFQSLQFFFFLIFVTTKILKILIIEF